MTSNNFTTTGAGRPIPSDELSLTLGPDGPVLMQDFYLIEALADFNRERVAERQPHAKGAGAFGRFEVTNDVSAYTRAAVFQPGTTTEAFVRVAGNASERGSADTLRDTRGFSVKFYTSEGNYDIVGNNVPMFFIRDAIKFPNLIRASKRRADNDCHDHNMVWDFWTLSPESAHLVTLVMGDRGIPKTFRHMNGYGLHTFSWVNDAGEIVWVKYHFKSDQGVESLTQEEADRLAGTDPDCNMRDLHEAIARGEHPSWSLKVQIMPFEDAKTYRINPFDVTKVWPHADYPLIDVGTLTLDRNITDHHTEVEQATFTPARPGAGNRPEPGQAPARAQLCLCRRSSAPCWSQPQSNPGQCPKGRGSQLHQGRRYAFLQPHRSGVRTQLRRRTTGGSRSGRRSSLGRRWPHGARCADTAPRR